MIEIDEKQEKIRKLMNTSCLIICKTVLLIPTLIKI